MGIQEEYGIQSLRRTPLLVRPHHQLPNQKMTEQRLAVLLTALLCLAATATSTKKCYKMTWMTKSECEDYCNYSPPATPDPNACNPNAPWCNPDTTEAPTTTTKNDSIALDMLSESLELRVDSTTDTTT